jgi:hypothetical protein
VDTATVAAQARERGLEGPQIGEQIQRSRTEVVAALLAQTSSASAA